MLTDPARLIRLGRGDFLACCGSWPSDDVPAVRRRVRTCGAARPDYPSVALPAAAAAPEHEVGTDTQAVQTFPG